MKTIKIITIICFLTSLIFSCQHSKIIRTTSSDNSKIILDTTIRRLSSFNNDTISYLKYLVSKNSEFASKPLSYFLSNLDIPIISFSAGTTLLKSENGSITLYAEDYDSYGKKANNIYQKPIEIVIVWEKVQSMDSIKLLFAKNVAAGLNSRSWSKDALNFFKEFDVQKIGLPYNFN